MLEFKLTNLDKFTNIIKSYNQDPGDFMNYLDDILYRRERQPGGQTLLDNGIGNQIMLYYGNLKQIPIDEDGLDFINGPTHELEGLLEYLLDITPKQLVIKK